MIRPELRDRILARWPVGVLSTYGRDRIDSVPIVFALAPGSADTTLISPIDGKPKSGKPLARTRNLARDPRFTLLLQHYDDNWSTLWWLRVSGEAAVAEPDAETCQRWKGMLESKYPQYRDGTLLSGTDTWLRLDVRESAAWAFNGDSTFESIFLD